MGIKKLPVEKDIETKNILKKLPSVHRALAELKGIASTMPNLRLRGECLAEHSVFKVTVKYSHN